VAEQVHVELFGDDEEMTFHLNVPEMTEPVEIHVDTTSGEASLHATDRRDIQVWLEVESGSSEDKVVTATWDGRRLDVAPARGTGLGSMPRHHASFNVRVEIPRTLLPRFGGPGIVARLNSASGEVTVGSVAGDIRVATASGDLTLDDVLGRIDCKSASGDVAIESLRGQLRVSTVSGDVTIEEAILDRWEINTVSGSVDGAIVMAGTGPYRLNTVSGDAELRLGILSASGRPDAFTVEFSSMSGDLEIEGTARKLGRRRWQIGPGAESAATIRLNSVSGDASITVEPAAIDGVVEASTGSWPGDEWGSDGADGEDHSKDDIDSGDLTDRITSSIESTIGKVHWAGIEATIDQAMNAAFPRRRRPDPMPPAPPAPPAPTMPTAPKAPVASAQPVDVVTGRAPFPGSPSEAGSSERAATARPEATPRIEDTADASRLDILRRIERGELSVEDGMAQLDATLRTDPAGH
jgi:hypothetical protein